MEMQNLQITKITNDGIKVLDDVVAVEAHFQVEINGEPAFAFTCTPSYVEEMVTGALYSRGYIENAGQIAGLEIGDSRIRAALQPGGNLRDRGTACKPQLDTQTIFHTVSSVFSDPDTLFNRTGCAHCCALMRKGELICAFEDIGRHNALDKVIGYALRADIPMGECVIFTSGRISGDYMAKIIRAGFPIAVSRAAVTSEAVRLAKESGTTLYGFVRGSSANCYNP